MHTEIVVLTVACRRWGSSSGSPHSRRRGFEPRRSPLTRMHEAAAPHEALAALRMASSVLA